jgi:hypothetical protein
MKIYHASLDLRVLKWVYERFKELINVLLSMSTMKGDTYGFLIAYRYMAGSIIADSGAWSVNAGTSNLTIEELNSYLQLWGHLFGVYFNFDTDFTDRGFDNNITNQIIMERAGLHPVPVVHNFFDDEIEYYVKSGEYGWLALGSSQSTNFDDMRYAVDKIKRWGNPDIRIHWFGGSRYDWLCQLPIGACDTSSWAKTGAYGYIMYWNPHEEKFNKGHRVYVGGRIREFKEGEYDFVTYPWRSELEEYLHNSFGLTFADLSGIDDKFNQQLVNVKFYTDLEKRINEERIKTGVPLE